MGSTLRLPSAWSAPEPTPMVSMISVAVLPMSIWPHVMPNSRPSSSMLLVRPVMACFVTA